MEGMNEEEFRVFSSTLPILLEKHNYKLSMSIITHQEINAACFLLVLVHYFKVIEQHVCSTNYQAKCFEPCPNGRAEPCARRDEGPSVRAGLKLTSTATLSARGLAAVCTPL
jgi:hypothetical protein